MRILIIALPVLMLTLTGVASANAQNPLQMAGIYRTEQDFIADKFTYAVDPSKKKNKFRKESHRTIIMISEHKREKFPFGSIYGYKVNGNMYRPVQKSGIHSHSGYAEIVDQSGLVIYIQRIHLYKNSHTHFHYSKTINGVIKPLTIENLEGDFSFAPDFIVKVKALREINRKALYKKDAQGRYEINNIFNETVKN